MFDELANLYAMCFSSRPWSAAEFRDLKKSGCEIVSSEHGFIVYRPVADEAEIITIGVVPSARRSGIAAAMLQIMESDVKKRGVMHIFLEVATNNAPAIGLYEKYGYVPVGRRPKYYDGVDAIVMRKDI